MKSSPRSPQLEKARTQQQRLNAAKKKKKKKDGEMFLDYLGVFNGITRFLVSERGSQKNGSE